MLSKIITQLKDSSFSIPLLSLIATWMMFRINQRTFKLISAKPKIKVNKIQTGEYERDSFGGVVRSPHIVLDILNPSSNNNRIISSSIRFIPFIKQTIKTDANIPLEGFGTHQMLITLDNISNSKMIGKYFIVTITDICGRKTSKLLKLIDKK